MAMVAKTARRRSAHLLLLAAMSLSIAAPSAAREAFPPSPFAVFGPLYHEVEMSGIFPDSKTFADAVPRRPPAEILKDYRPGQSKAALQAFVFANFDLPQPVQTPPLSAERPPLLDHITALWPALTRAPHTGAAHSSQLSMRHQYIVPGGRFREVYYWDSYFTMLGLMADGRGDLAQGLTDSFADLIGRYGHVPNGARTYYLSRSQPPFFYLMAGLLGGDDPPAGYARYLPALRAEHQFWMQGEDRVRPSQAIEHVVRLADGSLLNRYWDASDKPRDEAYKVDLGVAAKAGRPAPEVYRELRSAAESGWDFSSRWMADGKTLGSLQTTAITPVDLNSLLFGLEQAIAQGCARTGDTACAQDFNARAKRRQAAVEKHLWDEVSGQYLDLQWRTDRRLDHPSAAMLYPLFVGAASPERARRVAGVTREKLLARGGLRTTLVRTGQQWDRPNGWAPLQWIAASGLKRYGEPALAREIADRWVAGVCRTYRETGKLLEKYDVEEIRPGGGGEYPLQDGFGWTNGVTRALIAEGAAAAPGDPTCSGAQVSNNKSQVGESR
jgi:alpha,alpha-trehalase